MLYAEAEGQVPACRTERHPSEGGRRKTALRDLMLRVAIFSQIGRPAAEAASAHPMGLRLNEVKPSVERRFEAGFHVGQPSPLHCGEIGGVDVSPASRTSAVTFPLLSTAPKKFLPWQTAMMPRTTTKATVDTAPTIPTIATTSAPLIFYSAKLEFECKRWTSRSGGAAAQ